MVFRRGLFRQKLYRGLPLATDVVLIDSYAPQASVVVISPQGKVVYQDSVGGSINTTVPSGRIK